MSIVSEVNFGLDKNAESLEDEYVISRFRCVQSFSKRSSEPRFDEDGDLIRDSNEETFISIKHKLNSDLENVGLQIWRGSLFLADFAIQKPDLFKNLCILEIGAGTGLSSIAISRMCQAKEIRVTDLPAFQTLLQDNLQRNECKNASASSLDLKDFIAASQSYDVLIGADVIYDESITEAIINFLHHIHHTLKTHSLNHFFAIDKRYNFTLEALDSVAPAYEHFKAKLKGLKEKNSSKWKIEITEYSVQDVHQYFCYERSEDLIIVQIKSTLI